MGPAYALILPPGGPRLRAHFHRQFRCPTTFADADLRRQGTRNQHLHPNNDHQRHPEKVASKGSWSD